MHYALCEFYTGKQEDKTKEVNKEIYQIGFIKANKNTTLLVLKTQN